MERVSIGLPLLDQILGGGIPKGHHIIVGGGSGSGKTILSLQYLLHGVQKGDKGVFICLDTPPNKIIQIANSLGWPIQHAIESNSLSFLDVSDFFAKYPSIQSDQDIDRIIQNILQFSQHQDIQRLCIDPFIPFNILAEPHSRICYYIRKLLHQINLQTQCNTLLTCRSDHNKWIFQYIQSLTDGCIQLDNQKKRILQITKMSCTPIASNQFNYDIHPKRGMILRVR